MYQVGNKRQIPVTFLAGEGSNDARFFVGESAKRRCFFSRGEAPNHSSHNYANRKNMTRPTVVCSGKNGSTSTHHASSTFSFRTTHTFWGTLYLGLVWGVFPSNNRISGSVRLRFSRFLFCTGSSKMVWMPRKGITVPKHNQCRVASPLPRSSHFSLQGCAASWVSFSGYQALISWVKK